MMRGIGMAVVAAALAGCSDAPAPAPAEPAAKPVAAARADLPLSGRWRWAEGGRWLPGREVGCAPSQAKLVVKPNALDVEMGSWRQTAFAIVDWRQDGPDALTLRVEDTTAGRRRRLLVTLDVGHAGFVRFAGASDERGRPLAGWRDRTGREIAAEEDRAALAGAFTLIRCADDAVDVAALLRGPAAGERARVLR